MSRLEELITACPWLEKPELEVTAVGSTALYEACVRADLQLPPRPDDVDLSWRLDPEAGTALLREHGCDVHATEGALGRGTLGTSIAGQRIEITTYRGGGKTTEERLTNDAKLRDMTIGALFLQLWDNGIADPLDGLSDWRGCRIRACGLAEERIREHPIRAVRYLRRGVELGFWIESGTRRAIRTMATFVAAQVLPEALCEELRKVLARCASPGAFFQVAHEEQLLAALLPEVAPQFDGRPAGRLRWHPEISQGLHMVLALRAASRLCERDATATNDRIRLLLAVLCHDLGKGRTPEHELPSHPGHEAGGVPMIRELFARLSALGSKRTQRLCEIAARNHLLLERVRALKPGTVVDLWEKELVPIRDDLALLARVVRCDREGRLLIEDLGLPRPNGTPPDYETQERGLLESLYELDAILRGVSGEESARLHPGDPEALRAHLRERRCRTLCESGFLRKADD